MTPAERRAFDDEWQAAEKPHAAFFQRPQHGVAPWLGLCLGAAEFGQPADPDRLLAAAQGARTLFDGTAAEPWAEHPADLLDLAARHVLLARGRHVIVPGASPGADPVAVQWRGRWVSQAAEQGADWTWTHVAADGASAPVRLPALLVGGEHGVVAELRLWRVPAAGGGLRFVPVPASAITPLRLSFQKSLTTVSTWLGEVLKSTPATTQRPAAHAADHLLAWDLLPLTGSLGALRGDSAGAAFALGALWLLREFAPPAYRVALGRMHAGEFTRVAVSAALDAAGTLRPVQGVAEKAESLRLFRNALKQPMPIHVAHGQQVDVPPLDPDPPAFEPHKDMQSLLEAAARHCAPLSDAQRDLYQALLGDAAAPDVSIDTLKSVRDAPATTLAHYALKRWAYWALEQRGQLHHRFVPLSIQPEAPGQPGKPGGGRYKGLQELLDDKELQLEGGFLLRGAPGSGKTTLLRHHEQLLCRQALRDWAAGGHPAELPLCVRLSLLPAPPAHGDDGPVLAHWLAGHLRKSFPQVAELHELLPGAPVRPALRLLLDGLNELKVSAAEHRPGRALQVVHAFRQALGEGALPMLLCTRTHHAFDLPDGGGGRVLPVDVLPWEAEDIHQYMQQRFGAKPADLAAHWQALSGSAQAMALCTVPMHLDGQCELFEAGWPHPMDDRASLYLAWLWQRLRREAGLQADGRQRRNPWAADTRLLTADDLRAIDHPSAWRSTRLRRLPQQGQLLRSLFRQAGAHWRRQARAGKEAAARGGEAMHLADVAPWLDEADASGGLRQSWLQAVDDLGLARVDTVSETFEFTHPSWGEFLCSRSLLPQPTPQAMAPQDLRALLQELAPPPLLRRDSEELEFQHQQSAQAWAKVPEAMLGELRRDGLTLPLDAVRKQQLEHSGLSEEQLEVRLKFWTLGRLLDWQLANNQCRVNLQELGELAAVWDGLVRPELWWQQPQRWQGVAELLWPPFEDAFWRRLGAYAKVVHRAPGRLPLPDAGDLDEPLWLALQALDDPLPWLRGLCLHGLLRAAARGATAVLHRLEGPQVAPVQAMGAAPLLRHLRRLLLLRSVDAGADVRARVFASGLPALLELDSAQDTDAELCAAWCCAWEVAFRGTGVDLRERIQAALLLGKLGDTFRYEAETFDFVDSNGRTQRGRRLCPRQWLGWGKPGEVSTFRIGDDRGEANEGEEFCVKVGYFELAACCVTVAEWLGFVDDGGYDNAEKPWWVRAGPAAQAWLRGRLAASGGRPVRPGQWGDPALNNPLQPVVGITWFEAMAYVSWAAPVAARQDPRFELRLPTEVHWEAGVRGPWTEGQAQRTWPHPIPLEDVALWPDPLCFNHKATGWGRPSPVGVFTRGWTEQGLADAAGSCWEWTSNRYDGSYSGPFSKAIPATPASGSDVAASRMQRGGWFDGTADYCRIAARFANNPDQGSNTGLRLMRVWLPHLEPSTRIRWPGEPD
jgi:formylglycine-generating enzyme required for sulfatase activity